VLCVAGTGVDKSVQHWVTAVWGRHQWCIRITSSTLC